MVYTDAIKQQEAMIGGYDVHDKKTSAAAFAGRRGADAAVRLMAIKLTDIVISNYRLLLRTIQKILVYIKFVLIII